MARLGHIFNSRDREFFDLFEEAASNIVRAADLLDQMLRAYPDRVPDICAEITHEVTRLLAQLRRACTGIVMLGELSARVTRRPPMVSKDACALVAHGDQVSGARAAQELGLRYTPLEVGLPATLAWYWEQGLLRRPPTCLAHGAA